MAKLLYTWAKVQRGDIISFIYQNKEGRRLRRTILVLEPELKNLVHGIQLDQLIQKLKRYWNQLEKLK